MSADRRDLRGLRHHALFTALVAVAVAWTTAVFVNNWLQREWLAGKWLFRTPSGLFWHAVYAGVAVCALLGLLLAWRSGRWTSRSYAPLRWVLPAALGAAVCVWRIRPPTLPYDAKLAAAGAAAAWSAGVALLARAGDPSGRPWPRWARVLDVVLLEIAVCVFLAEMALRLVRRTVDAPLLATSGTDVDAWIRAHRLEPGTFHLGFPVNGEGYVDVAESARRGHLVACIGDSFSVAVVPHHLHYTTLAEEFFDDLAVHNIGVVNAGPREYLRMLETSALPLRPDLVVVALFVGNDLTEAHRQVTPLQSFTDRDEVLILQLPWRLWTLSRERRAGAGALGGGASPETFGVPRTLSLSPAEVERRLPWLADPLLEPPGLSATRFAYVQASRASITLPQRSASFESALAYLERMRQTANPIPIACLLIPDEYQVEDAQWEELSRAGLERGAERELPQQVLCAWLDAQRIPALDLLPRMRSATPLSDGNLHLYHLRDSHLNARGNRIAGAALAELIERCGVARRAR